MPNAFDTTGGTRDAIISEIINFIVGGIFLAK